MEQAPQRRMDDRLEPIKEKVLVMDGEITRIETELKYHLKEFDELKVKLDKMEKELAPMPWKEKLQIGAFLTGIGSAIATLLNHVL